MESHKQNIRLQIVVIVVGSALLIAKFTAYFITHSNSILTDALESIINVVAGSFALYSIILASKPQDKNHPYGHGKIEFISASLEGSMILFAGGAIIVKSIYDLFSHHDIMKMDVGFILISISGIVNYSVGQTIERRGVKTNSLTMVAGGKHLKSDAYSTFGLMIGIAIIYFTDYKWLDNVCAILFGGIICGMGIRILRRSVAGIMDEADYALLEKIIAVLEGERRENWVDIHNLRVIQFGSTYHVDGHLTLPFYQNVREAHREVTAVEQTISQAFPNRVEVFIHIDDCLPESCRLCIKQDCVQRSHPLEQRVTWTLENGMRNRRHVVEYATHEDDTGSD